MATLWLPATLHCGWEILHCDDPLEECSESCAPVENCDDDSCELVEEAQYPKPQADQLVNAPDLTPLLCLRCNWNSLSESASTKGVYTDSRRDFPDSVPQSYTVRVVKTTVLRL